VGAIAELSTTLGFDADDRVWMLEARCLDADPEAFFPEKGGSTREAKRICAACPVREDCLDHALSNDERFGIWGGLSERERRRVKRLAS
jgi:WhiB family transcriptional regulator, redox-sensing transcriptional regulator